MLSITLADLRFRFRQFLIAVLGTSVALGIALVISGLAAGFRAEVRWTVDDLGASSIVMSHSADDRLTAFAAVPQSDVAEVARERGAGRTSGFLLDPGPIATLGHTRVTVVLAGVALGGLGDPQRLLAGRPLAGPGQVVVDDRLHASLGGRLSIGQSAFTVVGIVSGRSLLGGFPLVFVTLHSAQAIAVHGQPLVTAVLCSGVPSSVPPGLTVSSPGEVVTATEVQMSRAIGSLVSSEWLMWAIAVIIVAALLYVVALERRRDFAVLKALGSSSSKLFQGLVLEAIIVTVAASAIGIALSFVISPVMQEVVATPLLAYLSLPFIGVVIGALASLAALRRVTGADPATAFA